MVSCCVFGLQGWDVLLEAYWKEFTIEDDVSLHIRTKMEAEDQKELQAFIFKFCQKQKTSLDRLAPVKIMNTPLPEHELPALYAAVDAFVLPSRGEGWGRPVQEVKRLHCLLA